MRIFFMPVEASGIYNKEVERTDVVFLHRPGEEPHLFMHKARVSLGYNDCSMIIYGKLCENWAFDKLQDDDRLFVTVRNRYGGDFKPFFLEMYANGDMLLPFQSEDNVLSIAAKMNGVPQIYLVGESAERKIDRAIQINAKASLLYGKFPAYQHIMIRNGQGIEPKSLIQLMSEQDVSKHEALTALILTFSSTMSGTTLIKRILEQCEYGEEFSLLTQEEQVEMFIEFSKIAASQKKEYVPDGLIEQIAKSPEYAQVISDLRRNGLGMSHTQQFNVFQQVGFFSGKRPNDILYNLSDMGAGKTLMTVESIYLMDLKKISAWKKTKELLTSDIEICSVFLPDKHIIAPTLSVKSSWIDTFRLFYTVTEKDDMTYQLSVTYDGITATSMVYVSSFTVKDGKIFVKEKLPAAEPNTYLIIDEIHQLVVRNVPKTKFFPPKTNPSELYLTFILSGTMSNLKTEQWYNYMRFMGIKITKMSITELKKNYEQQVTNYITSIESAVKNIRTDQHRYFDTEPVSRESYYCHTNEKKRTCIEEDFYAQYGTQILVPCSYTMHQADTEAGGVSVEDMLLRKKPNDYSMITDPSETDAINFELFYQIVGSQAVTAQSMQVAEELFGEQKKQHVSDIIKTVSPLSKEDIKILKTLHHIAEDHNQYKSTTIAKAINNAILNLNDGLQTKNIYDIVASFADKNSRFFEYLATLDVNVLEELPKSGLIKLPKLEETDKFKVLQDILKREKDEIHLIVVNDFYALKALSEALGIEHLTKKDLKQELDYQDVLDDLFAKQSVVIVTQDMIKSSLDLIQANRLIQYQLNTEISDIIQTQNRINRIGQTRETRGYYIASDQLQENLIELFLDSYRNIRVAHKGIVELFADITSQINVVNDYLEKAFMAIETGEDYEPEELPEEESEEMVEPDTDLQSKNSLPKAASIMSNDGVCRAILYPQNGSVMVLVPLTTGSAFPLGELRTDVAETLQVTGMQTVMWNLENDKIER